MQSCQGLATVRAVETFGRGKSAPAGSVFGLSTLPCQSPLPLLHANLSQHGSAPNNQHSVTHHLAGQ